MNRPNSGLLFCLLGLPLAIFVLSGCFPKDQHGFCDAPDVVEVSDIVGVWTTVYDDHWVWDPTLEEDRGPINGRETLTFSADGTYTQTFTNENYVYVSLPAQWRLDFSAPDSPKLRMAQMKYFASGETQAESDEDIALLPELPDRLRFQDVGQSPKWVFYPSDGFIYLYPRTCSRELILQQMVYGALDPDNNFFANPAFHLRK